MSRAHILEQRFSNFFMSRTLKSFIDFLRTPGYCKKRINSRLAKHEQNAQGPTGFDILGLILDKASWTSIMFRYFSLVFTKLEKATSRWYKTVVKTWQPKNWQKRLWFIVFHISIWGASLWEIDPPNPPWRRKPLYCEFVAGKPRNKTAKFKRILSWLHYWHANMRVSLKSSTSFTSFRSVKIGSLIRPAVFARTTCFCLQGYR